MQTIYMITGYKGTGKDTFYKLVKEKKITDETYEVYGCTKEEFHEIIKKINNRVSFADKVKILTKERWKDVLSTDCFTENNKDKKIGGINYTIRDLYILEAAMHANIDQLYWVKNVSLQENDIITDFRYPKEYNCLSEKYKIVTIRIFRKDIICKDDPIENLLDEFKTDIVLLCKGTNVEDFNSHFTKLKPLNDH